MKRYALIVAGGSGTRMGGSTPKQFLVLGQRPLLMHTISQFASAGNSIEIIVILPQNQIEIWTSLCSYHQFVIEHKLVAGGKTRFESVRNGLEWVEADSLVAIHDGVRPLISTTIIEESFRIAKEKGSEIAAVSLKDSIREMVGDSTVSKNRNNYFLVQTPQTFQSTMIKKYYGLAKSKESFTDDASVYEFFGENVTLIQGDYKNLKITTPEDLIIAQELLNNNT